MSMLTNALSGALAARTALTVTSQNVANVMTAGYTRQGVVLTAAQPSRSGPFAAGDGVNTPALIRFSDDYKSLQMWQAASNQGQHASTQPYLTQLEQVMGDDSASINAALDGFYSALNAASVEPTSSPLRQQVLSAADALAKRFNNLNQVLAGQRSAVNQQRTATVTQVNALSADIAALNQKIAAASATGASPSGLMDERDNKIDALSALVGLQVVNQPDGTRDLALRSGQPLVAGAIAGTLEVETDASGTQSLKVGFAKETFRVRNDNLGGELGGLNDFEGQALAPMRTAISDLAREVATQYNAVFQSGYAMNSTAAAPVNGKALFVYDASSSNAMLTLNPAITQQDLGFSSNPGLQGNSDKLIEAINLKNQPATITSLGTVLLGDVYTQLVSRLGTSSQQNSTALSVAETVRAYAESNWKSTSGVNEDEEAINLVQYQQMYQANMKVIAVSNELFDSTLAML